MKPSPAPIPETPSSLIREASCVSCGAAFYYDGHLWARPHAPAFCARHRSAPRREDDRQPHSNGARKLRAIFRWRQTDTPSSTAQLLRIRQKPFAIEPVLDDICDGIAAEPGKIHLVFGPRFAGKSTILPFGLIDTPEITGNGQIVIVEPSHDKVLKYASTLGQTYYDVYDPARERPDLRLPLCGPYLASGFRNGAQDEASELNLAWYSTRGKFQQYLREAQLGRCACILLSQPDRERDEMDFLALLERVLLYRQAHPQLTLVIGSETEDEAELVALTGGRSRTVVHHIPPL